MGTIIRTILKQRPADTVTIVFLFFLTALTGAFYHAIPNAPLLIALYALLIVFQIVLAKFQNSGKFIRFFYDLIFPTLCILLVFDSLEWVVHYVNPEDIDPTLIRLDYLIFGGHPTVMLEKMMNPYLTDILQIAYSTYYFIPVSFGIVLLFGNRRAEFNKSIFMILFCFYLSYLGYILFPALGPRFYLKDLQTTGLHGFFFAEPMMTFLNKLEGIKRDAFPSGHTGVTLIVLYLAYKYDRKFFRIALPVVSALIFATVYCRYHYVVDVIAGFALTLITIILGEWYYRWWLKGPSAGNFPAV
jgi:membrane-associated phospholipid phosphatase